MHVLVHVSVHVLLSGMRCTARCMFSACLVHVLMHVSSLSVFCPRQTQDYVHSHMDLGLPPAQIETGLIKSFVGNAKACGKKDSAKTMLPNLTECLRCDKYKHTNTYLALATWTIYT